MDIFALLTALAAIAKESGVEITFGRHLSLWDCTTGLPVSFPHATPYPYVTGDWYWVSVVGTEVNYKPSGTSYTGAASTTVEADAVSVLDVYVYDGQGNFNLLKVGSLLSQYYTKSEIDAMLGQVKTSLDTPLVPKRVYNIGGRSSSLPLQLPASANAGDSITVIFNATGAFTPTVTGTTWGDTLPQTVSGKTYVIKFTWTGASWLVQYLFG